MIRKILWITTKLVFCALVAAMLFIWQGGWWYVRPTHQWSLPLLSDERMPGVPFDSIARECPIESFSFDDQCVVIPIEILDQKWRLPLRKKRILADAKTGKRIHETASVEIDQAGCFDGKNVFVFVSNQNKCVTFFDTGFPTDARTFKLPKEFQFRRNQTEHCWISRDSHAFYVCDNECGTVWSIDLQSGATCIVLQLPESTFFSSDGLHLATADKGLKRLRIWNLETGKIQSAIDVSPSRIIHVGLNRGSDLAWLFLLDSARLGKEEHIYSTGTSRCVIRVADAKVIYQDPPGVAAGFPGYETISIDEIDDLGAFAIRSGKTAAGHGMLHWFNDFESSSFRRRYVRENPFDAGMSFNLPERFNEFIDLSNSETCVIDRNSLCLYGTVKKTNCDDWFKWLPQRLQDEESSMVSPLSNRLAFRLIFFDPASPGVSAQFFEHDCDSPVSVRFSESRKAMALTITGENRIDAKIFYLPMKTWWGLRLVIAMLPPFASLFVVPRLWRRFRLRLTIKQSVNGIGTG